MSGEKDVKIYNACVCVCVCLYPFCSSALRLPCSSRTTLAAAVINTPPQYSYIQMGGVQRQLGAPNVNTHTRMDLIGPTPGNTTINIFVEPTLLDVQKPEQTAQMTTHSLSFSLSRTGLVSPPSTHLPETLSRGGRHLGHHGGASEGIRSPPKVPVNPRRRAMVLWVEGDSRHLPCSLHTSVPLDSRPVPGGG